MELIMKTFYQFLEELKHYQWVTMNHAPVAGSKRITNWEPDPQADPFRDTRPSNYNPPKPKLQGPQDPNFAQFGRFPAGALRQKKKK
jgi:hypothetical protein